jgi:hypothetical protein
VGDIRMAFILGGFFLLAFLLPAGLPVRNARVLDRNNDSGTMIFCIPLDRFIIAFRSTGKTILQRLIAEYFTVLGGCNAAILQLEKE